MNVIKTEIKTDFQLEILMSAHLGAQLEIERNLAYNSFLPKEQQRKETIKILKENGFGGFLLDKPFDRWIVRPLRRISKGDRISWYKKLIFSRKEILEFCFKYQFDFFNPIVYTDSLIEELREELIEKLSGFYERDSGVYFATRPCLRVTNHLVIIEQDGGQDI